MKTKLCIGILLLTATWLRAQTTNDLTALLQQGLFEEQASRNLDAAIADYSALAMQFDKDRQLAATAVFRLGECYRAQGRTNEAATQYQRILRDFTDQQMLANLSRQDLAGMGMAGAPIPTTAGQNPELVRELEVVKKLQAMKLTDIIQLAPTLLTDGTLINLINQCNQCDLDLLRLRSDHVAETNSEVQKIEDIGQGLEKRIYERLDGLSRAITLDLGSSGNSVARSSEANAPAMSGDEGREIARIQQMIQNSPDLINAPSDGSTPLVKAAYNGWLKVAASLLDHGADVNARSARIPGRPDLFGGGPWQVPPLLAAVEAGNKAMVKFLIDRGADVSFKDPNRETVLHIAAGKGFQAVAEVLLASHAEVNARRNSGATPLFSAVEGGQQKIIQMLIAAGADPNLKDGQGRTVLNYAIKTSPEIFKTLLDAGADPNTEDTEGRTPLSYAAESDDLEAVKLLLAAKADPNGGKLDAPLLGAVEKGDATMAELLLKAGANPNAKGIVSWEVSFGGERYGDGSFTRPVTPLYFAITENHFPIVELLLKNKANPDDSQTGGRPVIFSALSDTNMLEALLDAGAKTEVRDVINASGRGRGFDGGFGGRQAGYGGPESPHRQTPLLGAAENNAPAVAVLLQHGADPNTSDDQGNTALHQAAMFLADESVFNLLLEHKADPNVRNQQGKTPLDLVKERMRLPLTDSRFESQSPQFLGGRNAEVSPEQTSLAEKLIALLRQHGALDKLPNGDCITFSRPAGNYSATVFQKNTNDWNHFTLLEMLYWIYERGGGLDGSWSQFPDLAHIVIARPSKNGATPQRIAVNLLDSTNRVDCSRDVPLEFGDVVEIPEREHTLADETRFLSKDQRMTILNYFQSVAGEAKLVVAGGSTVQLPLQPFFSPIGFVLAGNNARAALTSSSDFSRVKVTRRDPKSSKTNEWILDLSTRLNNQPTDLWLRDGDVIEVPEKP